MSRAGAPTRTRRATSTGTALASTAADQGTAVASSAADQGRAVATTAAEQGRAVATTAAGSARQLADAAKQQASGVVSEASEVLAEVLEEGRSLLDTTKSELEEQIQAQTTRLAEGLGKLGSEIQLHAGGRSYAEQAATKLTDAADALFGVADDVGERGVEGLVEDLGSFARRRPGVFLVGAGIVGFGVGRVVRGAAAADEESAEEEAPVAAPAPQRRRAAAGGSR